MRKLATTWMLLLVAALAIQTTNAQTVATIAEINTIPQDGIDAANALGGDITFDDIVANIRSPFEGETVQFTAVVISDPRNSGLSSVNSSTGEPSRVHYFVRDVAAATDGFDGQVMQVVDGNFRATGSLNLFVGDVVRFTGDIAYFGVGIQFSPSSVEFLGTYQDQGLPASILEPRTVTLADLNQPTGDNQGRANWDNFNALHQDFVRIEGVQVFQSPNRTDDRPNWALRDLSTSAVISNDDISLQYRNDRTDYPSDFNATNDFIAPPVGATVNVQGFALLRSSFDPFGIGDPAVALIKITPWEDADLVVTQSPPNISNIELPSTIPGNNPVTITASIVPDQTRSLTSVSLDYSTSGGASGSVAGVDAGNDTWTFEIPAQADRSFVIFTISATDSEGAVSTTVENSYRVLFDGITAVRDIQEPAAGSSSSPFDRLVADMDLEVTVMTDPATGVIGAQDGTSPWSGIILSSFNNPLTAAGVNQGDVIRITNAEVRENFGLTELRNYTFDVVSTGGDIFNPIVLPTSALQDSDVAESLEGMFVRVENVTVTATNADAPSGPFGEFNVSNGTEDDALRVDDASSNVSYEGGNPGTVFAEGETLAFVQGTLWFSFSNFKLQPGSFDDIGEVTNVANEDDVLPRVTSLQQNYPNPFAGETEIRYEVATSGPVTLDVYDVLGRKVMTLVSENQTAGEHSARFQADGMAGGLYLYRLQSGEKTLTRTMMLVK
ncbi:MAG: hypothetical protein COV99_06165 [Bacteroidetes bacterium CG12_big_fil_rev_8_21_14_0_65_60_17]|nr:MAG: hypothetical protein COV99_06165 [Bacteroidetes bacterium CG12_big_fil_rev_8_21_14_0_65_60_17]